MEYLNKHLYLREYIKKVQKNPILFYLKDEK